MPDYDPQEWEAGSTFQPDQATDMSAELEEQEQKDVTQDAALTAAVARGGSVFSTADYAAVSGDDRPRVVAAVAAALAAMAATGKDQTVLIHAPLTFTTGVTKAALGTTIDAQNIAFGNVGVPLPVNLTARLHIVFAPGAKVTLSANCRNMFYIDKLADYDVFQNVNFYNAWVDGANLALTDPTHTAHALVGNMPNYGTTQRYLSFQDINFYGPTRFTNFFWDADGSGGQGQLGIGFFGDHNGALEATQTFTKNVYLENGDMGGGAGLFHACSAVASNVRPGGVNHYYDNIVVDRYRCVMPSAATEYTNHVHTGIYITGAGFGDYAYIGPGYVENIGDDAIEVGTMQRLDIVKPRSKNPFFEGLFVRQTHAPIDVEKQRITIRDFDCEFTTARTNVDSVFFPIKLQCDDQVVSLTGTGAGGNGTITIPDLGTTSALSQTATALQIQTAVRAIDASLVTSVATGGPIGTAPVILKVAQVNLVAPITVSGGTYAVALSTLNASFGTVTIENPIWRADGLTQSRHHSTLGLFVNGLDQPHRRVEIIRPKIVLSNYSYDRSFDDFLVLLYVSAPYLGWGNLVLKDSSLTLSGTCDFSAGSGSAAFYEVLVEGVRTRVDIDGMTNDRAVATNAEVWMLGAAKVDAQFVRVVARRLEPKTFVTSGTDGGTILSGTGTCNRFNVFDSDFSKGVYPQSNVMNLSGAGSNADYAWSSRNVPAEPLAGATITPSGSPFTWKNQLGMTALVEISAGTVSLVEYLPLDGAFTSSAFTSGTWTVPPGCSLKVTYSVAPTMSYDLIR